MRMIRSWNLELEEAKGVVTILLFILLQESMMLFQKVKKRLSKASLLTHLARKSLCIWLRKGSHQLKHVQPHHILVCQYSWALKTLFEYLLIRTAVGWEESLFSSSFYMYSTDAEVMHNGLTGMEINPSILWWWGWNPIAWTLNFFLNFHEGFNHLYIIIFLTKKL